MTNQELNMYNNLGKIIYKMTNDASFRIKFLEQYNTIFQTEVELSKLSVKTETPFLLNIPTSTWR